MSRLVGVFFALFLSQTIFAADAQLNAIDLAQQLLVTREEFHRWERYVRGFRREHNFSLTGGISRGAWQVQRLGSLQNRQFEHAGAMARFQYSFHLQLYRGFGYFLGSSTGYFYESVPGHSEFAPQPAIMFPGILAGLVLNFNPVFRLSTGVDAYLERHNGISERDAEGVDTEISATLQTYDFGVFFDIFFDLAWALRLEWHMRRVDFMRPEKAQGFALDANFQKRDRSVGLGLVYHLL